MNLEKLLTWAEIDLDAYAHNIRELKRITQPQARLMAVVKANGYGHGAVEVARTALQNGAEFLGVARLHEAIELRKAGLAAPILIFGYSPPESAPSIFDNDLIQTVYSPATARALSEEAARRGAKIQVHIKLDSGMGRLGLLLDDPADEPYPGSAAARSIGDVKTISRLANLEVGGMFTHFATADSADKSYANAQLERFMAFLSRLESDGLTPPLRHAANSAALIHWPDSHLDLVRPGIATYGLNPSDEIKPNPVELRPVMTVKSRIIHLKQVPAGFHISYGITYRTDQPTTIATVPVGYADGLNRLLSSRGYMLVHGRRVPIVGRVCMDLTMLDVGALDDVQIEDEVVVFGRQSDEVLAADELATAVNTINYEVVTSITGRVPRIYKK